VSEIIENSYQDKELIHTKASVRIALLLTVIWEEKINKNELKIEFDFLEKKQLSTALRRTLILNLNFYFEWLFNLKASNVLITL